MRENSILHRGDALREGDEVAARGEHRHWDVLALIVCILLAFLVWLCVMNVRDTAYVSLEIKDPAAEYTYELSVSSLEVEGKTAALKRADALMVSVPSVPGEYTLVAGDIHLPEGVNLTGAPQVKVTVRAK